MSFFSWPGSGFIQREVTFSSSIDTYYFGTLVWYSVWEYPSFLLARAVSIFLKGVSLPGSGPPLEVFPVDV